MLRHLLSCRVRERRRAGSGTLKPQADEGFLLLQRLLSGTNRAWETGLAAFLAI